MSKGSKLQRLQLVGVSDFEDSYAGTEVLYVGDGNSICGTIVSDTPIEVWIYQSPDKTNWPIADSFTTTGSALVAEGDSFDVKVLDLYASVEFYGDPTVFSASINLARSSV